METKKKAYTSPQLVSLGTIEELTQSGGGSVIDVPGGTPANTPGGVTGSAFYG